MSINSTGPCKHQKFGELHEFCINEIQMKLNWKLKVFARTWMQKIKINGIDWCADSLFAYWPSKMYRVFILCVCFCRNLFDSGCLDKCDTITITVEIVDNETSYRLRFHFFFSIQLSARKKREGNVNSRVFFCRLEWKMLDYTSFCFVKMKCKTFDEKNVIKCILGKKIFFGQIKLNIKITRKNESERENWLKFQWLNSQFLLLRKKNAVNPYNFPFHKWCLLFYIHDNLILILAETFHTIFICMSNFFTHWCTYLRAFLTLHWFYSNKSMFTWCIKKYIKIVILRWIDALSKKQHAGMHFGYK